MAEIGIRSGWKHDGYKRSFLIQEVCSAERMEMSHGGIGMREEVLKPLWRQRTRRRALFHREAMNKNI